MKNNIIGFLIIILHCSFSSDSLKVAELSKRVESLEEYNEEVLDGKFDNKITELQNRIDTNIQTSTKTIQDSGDTIIKLGQLITFLFSIGLIGFLYQIFFGIKRKIDKMVNEKLEKHFKQNTQSILELIKSQNTEIKIKKDKKILVLSGSDDEMIITLLKKMGFKNVFIQVVEDFQAISCHDLVIFSNYKRV